MLIFINSQILIFSVNFLIKRLGHTKRQINIKTIVVSKLVNEDIKTGFN